MCVKKIQRDHERKKSAIIVDGKSDIIFMCLKKAASNLYNGVLYIVINIVYKLDVNKIHGFIECSVLNRDWTSLEHTRVTSFSHFIAALESYK